jgi:hypothetical protein
LLVVAMGAVKHEEEKYGDITDNKGDDDNDLL